MAIDNQKQQEGSIHFPDQSQKGKSDERMVQVVNMLQEGMFANSLPANIDKAEKNDQITRIKREYDQWFLNLGPATQSEIQLFLQKNSDNPHLNAAKIMKAVTDLLRDINEKKVRKAHASDELRSRLKNTLLDYDDEDDEKEPLGRKWDFFNRNKSDRNN